MEGAAMNLLLEISRFTAEAFVAGLWQGIVLISTVAIFLRVLPRLSAGVRFAIWGFAFALVAAVPLLHLRMPAVGQSHAPSALVHLGANWGLAIAGVWAVLMAVRGAQLVMQAIRLRRIWQRATPIAAGGEILAALRIGGRTAELCTSPDVDSPSVIGFFSPRLLIPEWLFAELTEPELRQIVLHECEHLRRRDDWMNLLQKVGLALFPLNPALMWVDRRLSLERELACDAGVVASTAAPFDYANCLTRLAEHGIRCRNVALSLSAWSRESELARRVHSLLRPVRGMSPLQARASIALLGVGLAGGAVGMARAPRFVSFADAVSAPVEQGGAIATTALSPAAAQAVPVVYREAKQPHATLLKAVLPTANGSHVLSLSKQMTKHKPQQQTQLRSVNAVRALQQPRMVLTTATQTNANAQRRQVNGDSARQVYAISTEFSPSYAAVPFGDGWLIIQL